MPNNALSVNPYPNGFPNPVNYSITTHGSDWLWAVFAVMALSDLIVIGWHFTIPRGQRTFHQLVAIILTTASIAYFCMASDLGQTGIATEFSNDRTVAAGVYRAIWYVRYIDWVITTPCLLLTLVLASGLPLSDIITLVFFDLVMIITGLVGALVASTYKWGFYTFGCAALIYIWWVLIGPARASAGLLGNDYRKAFTTSAAILSFLWLLYPIAWGLADGGNVITPDSEMIFYGILDLLAKPVYSFIHLFALSRLDLTALQLSSGKFTSSAAGVSAYDREKHANPNAMTNNAGAAPVTGQKKGMFGRRGHYDATAPNTTESAPRTSEATVAPQ